MKKTALRPIVIKIRPIQERTSKNSESEPACDDEAARYHANRKRAIWPLQKSQNRCRMPSENLCRGAQSKPSSRTKLKKRFFTVGKYSRKDSPTSGQESSNRGFTFTNPTRWVKGRGKRKSTKPLNTPSRSGRSTTLWMEGRPAATWEGIPSSKKTTNIATVNSQGSQPWGQEVGIWGNRPLLEIGTERPRMTWRNGGKPR